VAAHAAPEIGGPMSIAATPHGDTRRAKRGGHFPPSIVLSGIAWRTYEALLADLSDGRVRLTYDRGSLEIMAPTFNHERSKRKIGRVVETLAEEINQPIVSGGSTTFRREDLARGLEPDDCFYLANVPAILGKLEIDLRVDPPPDLALEIEVSRSVLDRLGIYAALGVPELWCYDGHHLKVFVLRAGAYVPSAVSPAFPMVDMGRLEVFLSESIGLDDGGLVKAFRAWLKPFIAKP
jgi:Uma2 family endonuclease